MDGEIELPGSPEAVCGAFDQSAYMLFGVLRPDNRIVAFNQTAVRLFDSIRIGTPLHEAYPGAQTERLSDLYDEVYRTGEPKHMHQWRFQYEKHNGTQVEMYLDFVLTPWRDDQGAIVGIVGSASDVTALVEARQAAEREQAASEGRYLQAQQLVTALQRELLPGGVPVLPGVEIAASYLLADADTDAGGDWFDATPLPDGRVALVVGDVVGHGVRASAVMGKLQVLLSETLAETGSITIALETADRFAQRERGARAATACVVVVDPDSGDIDYVTAGHPPPLIVPTSGDPRYVAATGDGPLATGTSEFTLAHDTLAPGDVVLLYTDGILERPGRDLAGASVELAQVAADVAAGRALRSPDPTTVERVAVQSLELLTRSTGHSDDITLLAAQRAAPAADFTLRAAAVPDTVAEVRAGMDKWLHAAHVPTQDAHDLQHALGELVTNAVEHAYRDSPDDAVDDTARDAPAPGPVTVSATLTRAGQVQVHVRDQGRWREPSTPTDPAHRTGHAGRTGSSAGRGRGLWMASRLVDELAVEHPGGATEAFLGHRLTRPAQLLTGSTLAAGPDAASGLRDSLVVEHDRSGRLRLTGPIDTGSAPEVAAALAHASAAGTRALVVDLAGVTHLASAGVSVLFAADARSLAHGIELTLYAPAGTPAGQVLTLVALPHTSRDEVHDAG